MTPRTQAVDVLCKLLETGDEADRCYATRTLGVLGDDSVVDTLIKRLRDEDIDVCVDAAEALGTIGSASAVPALIESLENDTSGEICSSVAASLSRIGGDEAVDALIKVATERPEELAWDGDWDTWWDVQLEAVKGLGRSGQERAVATLLHIIDNEEYQDIETNVLAALATIPGTGIEALIDRLQNQEFRVQRRRRAANALGKADSPEAVRVLGRILQDDEPEIRAAAALALGEQGAERYLRALILLLRDPDEEVRESAIKAATRIAEESADAAALKQELLPMLSDPSSQVRTTLFTTLIPLVASTPLSEESLELVTANLDDQDFNTAAAACTLLGRNGNPDTIPQLLRTLDDRSKYSMVRREAALSLGKIGHYDAAVVESLTRAVGDKDQAVRMSALTALMELEASGTTIEEQELDPPLQTVIAAVKGEVEIQAEGQAEEAETASGEESETESDPQAQSTTDGNVVQFDPHAEQRKDSTESVAEPLLPLPDQPARIVQDGEVKPAMSTLDAITMDNVDALLNPDQADAEPELDEETEAYLEVVEDNKEIMRRMRSNRKIKVEQDIRRLGARILGTSTRTEAIETLIMAMSDDDPDLRSEAAAAIGEIALKNREIPELMNAVGSLITQLGLGDLDQRLASARTLGYLGNRSAIAPLTEAVHDKEATVRIHAVEALALLATEGADPAEQDHMVVETASTEDVLQTLRDCLGDQEIGVRIAAAKGLRGLLATQSSESLIDESVERIVDSVFKFSGEESRLMGKVLRGFDNQLVTGKLLSRLESAEDSLKRSVAIEMLEEVLITHQGRPEQAA
jgi:HEAT repeat protein